MLRRLRDFIMTLVVFGTPFIFVSTYTGPYKWLAEAQLALMDRYYIWITLLLTALGWLFICALAVDVFRRMRGEKIRWLSILRSYGLVSGFHRQLPSIIIAAALVPLVFAGYYEYRYRTTSDVTRVSVEGLACKWWPPGAYLSIDDASIDPDLATGFTKGDRPSSTTNYYIPLLPRDYQKGQEIHAFIEVDEARLKGQEADPKLMRTGLVSLLGLPGMIRIAFERNGLPPAKGYVLLGYGTTSADLRDQAGLDIMLAILIIGGGVFVWFRVRKILQISQKAVDI